MKRADAAGALVWLALGLAAAWAGHDLGLGAVREPGSGLMLFWVGLVMAGLSLAVLLAALRQPPSSGGGVGAGTRWGKLVAVVAALIVYAWALERLGFLPTTVLVLVFLFKAVEPQRWWVAIAGAVVTTVVAWVVFQHWLGAQLPNGVWGFG